MTGLYIDGFEYIPGAHISKIRDLIGVILQGVSKDDGKFFALFLHEQNEFGGEYAILLGDLDLDLDPYMDLA